jgi:hypothetical protein
MQLRARATTFFGILAFTAVPNPAAAGSAGHDVQAWLSAAAASRAVAVSDPIIRVDPLALSFGVVNIGEQASREYTIQNVGDEDLEVGAIVISDPRRFPSFLRECTSSSSTVWGTPAEPWRPECTFSESRPPSNP